MQYELNNLVLTSFSCKEKGAVLETKPCLDPAFSWIIQWFLDCDVEDLAPPILEK